MIAGDGHLQWQKRLKPSSEVAAKRIASQEDRKQKPLHEAAYLTHFHSSCLKAHGP